MVRSATTLQQANMRTCETETGQTYWSLLHGEFPWCLDDSEQTGSPNELIGCFDLVLADPPRVKRLSGTRMRTPPDRCQPDTGWVQYAELFLREQGSLLIFAPLESVGAYVSAVTNAGFDYRATYIWNNATASSTETDPASQSIETILWAAKDAPHFKSFLLKTSLIDTPDMGDGKQWLIELLIETFTETGMAVLEPFTIDSRVLAACQKLQRYCLGVARKRSHIKQVEHILSGALKQTA